MEWYALLMELAANHSNLEITGFLEVARWIERMTAGSTQTSQKQPWWCTPSVQVSSVIVPGRPCHANSFLATRHHNQHHNLYQCVRHGGWALRRFCYLPHGPCDPGVLVKFTFMPSQIRLSKYSDLNPLVCGILLRKRLNNNLTIPWTHWRLSLWLWWPTWIKAPLDLGIQILQKLHSDCLQGSFIWFSQLLGTPFHIYSSELSATQSFMHIAVIRHKLSVLPNNSLFIGNLQDNGIVHFHVKEK